MNVRSERQTMMNKTQKLLQSVFEACQDVKGENIVLLNLSDIESYADYVLLVTGSNQRQIQSVADRVMQQAFKDVKRHPLGVEGFEASEWVLIDFGDVVCHVFSHESREVYHLEDMWPKIVPIASDKIPAFLESAVQPTRKKAARRK